jgi:5-(carboxyamino)imidazole ribonucleotide mutase
MPAKTKAPVSKPKAAAVPKPKVKPKGPPVVGIIMGSISDWETMENAAKLLADFGVPYETKVVSAHRTPQLLVNYATTARKRVASLTHRSGAIAEVKTQ